MSVLLVFPVFLFFVSFFVSWCLCGEEQHPLNTRLICGPYFGIKLLMGVFLC